jgi:thiol-disulfide isomerase/thioredoxin
MKKLKIILCAIGLFLLSARGEGQQPASMQMYIFYANDCTDCQAILQNYVPTLKSQYPFLDIRTFELGEPSNYEALAKLERGFNRRGEELPVIFIGDQMLSGEREVMEKLDPLILEYQMKGDLAPSLPPLEIASAAKASEKTFSVDMAYFYQKGCSKCDRASYLLKYVSKKYPHLNVTQIDLNTVDGKRLNETLSNRSGLPPEKRLIAPSIFIGNDFLSPEEITESGVEALIEKYSEGVSVGDREFVPPSLSATPEETKKAEESIVERFKSLGLLTILSAGFIDGLNPCAFATLIFFISYLTFVGRKRNEILWVGMGFSGSVFATYLLIGLGILSFVQHLSFLPMFSRIVYLLTITIAFVLGALSLYDYIQLKRGKSAEMKLQLPNFLKKRIHQTIRKDSKSNRYFLAAVGSGFVISLLEFTCTGQVYLPTILFVTNIPSLRSSAISYLFLYNFMFIIPLLAIFGIVYWGVTSEQLSFFLQKRASVIKLITSLLFFALAGVLILNLI